MTQIYAAEITGSEDPSVVAWREALECVARLPETIELTAQKIGQLIVER